MRGMGAEKERVMSRQEWGYLWFLLKDILKREKRWFASMVLFGAAEGFLPYIGILGMGGLLDGAYAGAGAKKLFTYAFGILLGTLVCRLVRERAAESFWQKLDYTKDLESKGMNAKSLTMDYEYLEEVRVQELRSRAFSKSFFGIQGWFLWHFRDILTAAFSFALTLGLFLPVLFQKGEGGGHFGMIGLSLGLFMIMGIMVRLNYRTSVGYIREIDECCNTMDGLFHKKRYFAELLSGAEAQKDLRMNAQQEEIEREIGEVCDKLREKQLFQNRLYEKRKAVALSTTGICELLVYLLVGLQAYLGRISIGSVVVYAAAMVRLSTVLNYFGVTLGHLKQMAMFAGDYAQYMGLGQRKYAGTIPVEKRRDNRFHISFEHVSFRYPGAEQESIRDLTISFEIGEKMAIVGKNGSGKSTFIKLLCRLYDVTEGVIRLNGIDIRKYDPEEYARLFAVVFQDFSIFAFPLGENIAASREVEEGRAVDALARVGLGERLADLPLGLATCVGKEYEESGIAFSGGEKQKMAIARAIYKDAPFVIMDEPTAALDPLAECEVYAGFDKMVGNKTALYISHRLASCRFCEDILVFDQGRVVQRGSHEDLKEQEGLYRRLWKAQAQYYDTVLGKTE